MKISADTLSILKNFSVITEGLRFTKGNVLRTINNEGTIIAEAVVDEEFPKDFVIYNLNTFLGVHSLFTDAELDIGDKSLKIKNENRTVNYIFADDSTMPHIKKVKDIEFFTEFTLKDTELQQILKASDILGVDYILFASRGNGSPVVVKVQDVKNPANTFELEIQGTSSDKTFSIVHSRDNFKILPGGYKISCAERLSKFDHLTQNIHYWIGADKLLTKVD